MAQRDIIVAGASAGGIEVLCSLVGELPHDLPASIFIVVHIPAWRKSELPAIFSSHGRLPAIHPGADQPIEPGRIYIAPPDHHLLIGREKMHLSRGPREHRHRPAIDPLFRSAASVYGERVAGLIVSGALDDGVAGLWQVKHNGGIAIVQNPKEAAFPDMPCSALERVAVDYIVQTPEMGGLLTNLSNGRVPPEPGKNDLKAAGLAECKRRRL